MMQALLLASLLFNAGFLYKTSLDEIDETNDCSTYECHAYEDFLEEWYKYDRQRQENDEIEEFYFELPEEEYDGPLEEI